MTCICYGKLRLLNCWEATYRLKCLSHEERSCFHKLSVKITELDTAVICFWLQRFVLEVRKRNGEHFCLDSLHQLCCELQRDLNFQFAQLHS